MAGRNSSAVRLHRRLAGAVIVAAALGAGAPAGHAAPPASFDCGFDPVGDPTVVTVPENHAVYGYVVADEVVQVTIRCSIRVDGVETAATVTGSGTAVAIVRDYLYIDASDTQRVELCAEWTAGSSSGESCGDARRPQVPPQEVYDLLDRLPGGG